MTVSDLLGRVIATIFEASVPGRFHRISPHEDGPTVESPLFSQKAHLAFGVASHQTDDHGFLLSPLEAVNAAKFDPAERLFEWRQDRKL